MEKDAIYSQVGMVNKIHSEVNLLLLFFSIGLTFNFYILNLKVAQFYTAWLWGSLNWNFHHFLSLFCSQFLFFQSSHKMRVTIDRKLTFHVVNNWFRLKRLLFKVKSFTKISPSTCLRNFFSFVKRTFCSSVKLLNFSSEWRFYDWLSF